MLLLLYMYMVGGLFVYFNFLNFYKYMVFGFLMFCSFLPYYSVLSVFCMYFFWMFMYGMLVGFLVNKNSKIFRKTTLKGSLILSIFMMFLEMISWFMRLYVIFFRFFLKVSIGHFLIQEVSGIFIFLEVFVVLMHLWMMYVLLEEFSVH